MLQPGNARHCDAQIHKLAIQNIQGRSQSITQMSTRLTKEFSLSV